jgi:hypothetical protein
VPPACCIESLHITYCCLLTVACCTVCCSTSALCDRCWTIPYLCYEHMSEAWPAGFPPWYTLLWSRFAPLPPATAPLPPGAPWFCLTSSCHFVLISLTLCLSVEMPVSGCVQAQRPKWPGTGSTRQEDKRRASAAFTKGCAAQGLQLSRSLWTRDAVFEKVVQLLMLKAQVSTRSEHQVQC